MNTRLHNTLGYGIVGFAAMFTLIISVPDANGQIWWQGAPCPPPYSTWGPSGYWSPGVNISPGGVSFNISFGSGYSPSYYPVPGYSNPIYYNGPVYYPQPAPPVSPPPRQPVYHFPNGNGWTLTPGRLPRGIPSPGRM